MSRTLSIDKIGPGPGFLGRALPPSQPSCGDLGVSLRRSSLQFNIRPWRISALGNPLLRLGLPRPIRQSRVAGGALGARRKRARGQPQRPRVWPQGGMDRACTSRPTKVVAFNMREPPFHACGVAATFESDTRIVGLIHGFACSRGSQCFHVLLISSHSLLSSAESTLSHVAQVNHQRCPFASPSRTLLSRELLDVDAVNLRASKRLIRESR